LFAEAEAQAAAYKGCKRRAGASTEALHPTLHPTNETSGEKTSNISLLFAFSIFNILRNLEYRILLLIYCAEYFIFVVFISLLCFLETCAHQEHSFHTLNFKRRFFFTLNFLSSS
jgi:hypothetical protein